MTSMFENIKEGDKFLTRNDEIYVFVCKYGGRYYFKDNFAYSTGAYDVLKSDLELDIIARSTDFNLNFESFQDEDDVVCDEEKDTTYNNDDSEKIQEYRLSCDPNKKYAWNGSVTVTLDRDDLNILVSALKTAEFEGCISEYERDRMLDMLNVSI